MTRYYNENPQVIYWKDKCAALQQELDKLRKEYEKVKSWRNFWRDGSFNDAKRISIAFERFNSLPWYKKMFYKFNV